MIINRHRIIEEDLIRIVSAELPWPNVDGTTVLITGAYGFVAAYITEALLFLNEQKVVRNPIKALALERTGEKALQQFPAYDARPDPQFLLQDVSDPLKPAADSAGNNIDTPRHEIQFCYRFLDDPHYGRSTTLR
jgi:hypothetical protein